jgi:hypothetical protein
MTVHRTGNQSYPNFCASRALTRPDLDMCQSRGGRRGRENTLGMAQKVTCHLPKKPCYEDQRYRRTKEAMESRTVSRFCWIRSRKYLQKNSVRQSRFSASHFLLPSLSFLPQVGAYGSLTSFDSQCDCPGQGCIHYVRQQRQVALMHASFTIILIPR